MRIVLFDIDGTLISTRGAGMRAIFKSLKECFGKPFPGKTWEAAGKTDYLILKEMTHEMGVSDQNFDESYKTLRERYLGYLKENLADSQPLVMPGVTELLDRLDEKQVPLGLLTGNFKDGAVLKLDAVGLWGRFAFGAYGDEVEKREALPALAKINIEVSLGHPISKEDIILIGDTPRDVDCARAGHCGILATATGPFSQEELKSTGTPHVVADLSDTGACMDILLG